MTDPNLDPNRTDDVRRVTGEVSDRLTALGITLTGAETPDELVRIQDAVERFEVAVESRGGDLMVDEGPGGRTTAPDDPHFVLPNRSADESVDQYLDRLARATDEVQRHERTP
jgi:hypothetical protein